MPGEKLWLTLNFSFLVLGECGLINWPTLNGDFLIPTFLDVFF